MSKGFEPGAIVSAAAAAKLAGDRGIAVESLMLELLPGAAAFAHPPISRFRVGVVARGLSGALYAGANYEIDGQVLGFTVHAEQSAFANAWMAGERGIDRLAVTAAPCGHCRQFLNELVTADSLTVHMPDGMHTLRDLLPSAFGPEDLDVREGLMGSSRQKLGIDDADELTRAAAAAAAMSYAPYSGAFAGVAVRTETGAIVSGAYAENAAFNPSLPPLQVALSQMNLRRMHPESIVEVVLVQVGTMHSAATRLVLSAVSDAPLRIVTV